MTVKSARSEKQDYAESGYTDIDDSPGSPSAGARVVDEEIVSKKKKKTWQKALIT